MSTLFDRIIVVGDTHADFSAIRVLNHKHRNTTFIHVGDVGVGFGSKVTIKDNLTKLALLLKANDNKMIAIRGNHDDPAYFDDTVYEGSIQLLRDNQVIRIGNRDVLFIGGGLSIDRLDRLRRMARPKSKVEYWPDETVVIDWDKIKSLPNVDVVVTHTAPWCAPPTDKNFNHFVRAFCNDDPPLFEDLTKERQLLSDLKTTLLAKHDIERWYYGHFHERVTFECDQIQFECLHMSNFGTPIQMWHTDITEFMLSDKRTLP